MRKAIRNLGVLSIAATSALLLPGTAEAAVHPNITWHQVGDCTKTKILGAEICFYWATGNQAQGRFVNNSSQDIENTGQFQVAATGQDVFCGDVTTKHGTTSTCTRTLNGTWRLQDVYHYSSTQYTIVTDSHNFNS